MSCRIYGIFPKGLVQNEEEEYEEGIVEKLSSGVPPSSPFFPIKLRREGKKLHLKESHLCFHLKPLSCCRYWSLAHDFGPAQNTFLLPLNRGLLPPL
jgi:hypothetical protein